MTLDELEDGSSDAELLGLAIKNIRQRGCHKQPRWVHVKKVFLLGSTYSETLCRRFGLDPNELI